MDQSVGRGKPLSGTKEENISITYLNGQKGLHDIPMNTSSESITHTLREKRTAELSPIVNPWCLLPRSMRRKEYYDTSAKSQGDNLNKSQIPILQLLTVEVNAAVISVNTNANVQMIQRENWSGDLVPRDHKVACDKKDGVINVSEPNFTRLWGQRKLECRDELHALVGGRLFQVQSNELYWDYQSTRMSRV
ncbi:hypothetical protein EYF80_030441 [Liparis tanakae]|uniref:Uncharacterized protein n=1 Tax=Liparis tanakae TaxID=230148 RepID=A0A4Z2H0I1_9TELE|nr:hypothetical protein EYF80_030441 [Liparis tanakae]